MSMKNSDDIIGNRTNEHPAFDPFTSPPYFSLCILLFFGGGNGLNLGTFRNVFWKLGESGVKRNFTFLYKGESVLFLKILDTSNY